MARALSKDQKLLVFASLGTAIPKAFLGSEGPQSVVCEGVFGVTQTKQSLKVLFKLSPS